MKLDINVTVHNELLARLDAVPKKLRAALESKFREGIDDIYHKSISILSGGKYSSTEEVQYGVEVQGNLLIGYIEPITIKTQVQEFGGKTYYEILPTKAKVLRFIGRSGELVFAKRVFHPPVRGKHYISETIANELPHLKAQLIAALQGTRI